MISVIENPTLSSSNSEASDFHDAKRDSDASWKISEKAHENTRSQLIAFIYASSDRKSN